MIALKDSDNTARKVAVVGAISAALLDYLKMGAVDDVTVVISGHGNLRVMTTLTARECLDVMSDVADDAINHGGV